MVAALVFADAVFADDDPVFRIEFKDDDQNAPGSLTPEVRLSV
jgi:hypothetical protein